MTSQQTLQLAPQRLECPLCHTEAKTWTVESVRAGATWSCARCGQTWSAERLDRVASYARFAAEYDRPATDTRDHPARRGAMKP